MNVNGTVSVIIPNFNGEVLLAKNLPKVIDASKHKSNQILEIIVVDDNSTDRSVKLLKKFFPEVTLVKHKVNRGFASAVNTGVRSSKGKYIALLNTDVSVSKYFLKPCLPHFKDNKMFAVSFHEKDYSWTKGLFNAGYIVYESGPESKEAQISFWASGGSAIFRKSMWKKLGGFDELLYKFYWEDVDIAFRAQKRGWKVVWEPRAHVVHKHESTISKVITDKNRVRMQEANQLKFIWKNLTSPSLFRKHIGGVLIRVIKNPGYAVPFVMTLRDLRQIRRLRKKEKKESKVSDESVFAQFD